MYIWAMSGIHCLSQMRTMVLEYLPHHHWAIFGVNVGKYSIHGASGCRNSGSTGFGLFLLAPNDLSIAALQTAICHGTFETAAGDPSASGSLTWGTCWYPKKTHQELGRTLSQNKGTCQTIATLVVLRPKPKLDEQKHLKSQLFAHSYRDWWHCHLLSPTRWCPIVS